MPFPSLQAGKSHGEGAPGGDADDKADDTDAPEAAIMASQVWAGRAGNWREI